MTLLLYCCPGRSSAGRRSGPGGCRRSVPPGTPSVLTPSCCGVLLRREVPAAGVGVCRHPVGAHAAGERQLLRLSRRRGGPAALHRGRRSELRHMTRRRAAACRRQQRDGDHGDARQLSWQTESLPHLLSWYGGLEPGAVDIDGSARPDVEMSARLSGSGMFETPCARMHRARFSMTRSCTAPLRPRSAGRRSGADVCRHPGPPGARSCRPRVLRRLFRRQSAAAGVREGSTRRASACSGRRRAPRSGSTPMRRRGARGRRRAVPRDPTASRRMRTRAGDRPASGPAQCAAAKAFTLVDDRAGPITAEEPAMKSR